MIAVLSKKKIFIWINAVLVLLWCGTIFYLSAQTAPKSDGQSIPIADGIVRTIDKIENKKTPESIIIQKVKEFNNSLRDAAHSGCYFIFALLFINLLHLLNLKKWKAIFITVIFCMLYALSDEIHQLFVPGRAFQLIDLTNDLFGVLSGLGLFYLIRIFLFKIQRRAKLL